MITALQFRLKWDINLHVIPNIYIMNKPIRTNKADKIGCIQRVRLLLHAEKRVESLHGFTP
ncbi:MAG: hypothetical protein ACI897_001543 [Flavobacteriales bacterium]|jgi:hypothetical protein